MKRTKAPVAVCDNLLKRMDAFSRIEHLNYIQHVLMPKFDNFSKDIDFFHSSNEDCRNIIKEFDKSMCTKATKIQLVLWKNEISSTFINKDEFKEHENLFDDLKFQIL